MSNYGVIREILNYCNENTVDYSYYEIATYAYKNEIESWIKIFKNRSTANMVAAYLESKHKESGTKCKKPKCEAMREYNEARSEYVAKQNKAYIEKLDAMEASVMNED